MAGEKDQEYVEKLEELLCKACLVLSSVPENQQLELARGFTVGELYEEIREVVGS